MNRQTEYGADVLCRIRAAENQNVAEKLKEQVEGVLEKGNSRFRKKLMPEEEMILVLAANTTMTLSAFGEKFPGTGTGALPCFLFTGCGNRNFRSQGVCFFREMSASCGEILWRGVCACKMGCYQRRWHPFGWISGTRRRNGAEETARSGLPVPRQRARRL